MKRFFSFFVMMFAATSVMLAAEGGKLTSSKTPINPTETVTLNYDGTGTNFANWEPQCFVHAWLEAAEGKTFSKEYRPAWASCNGDEDYKNLDAKVKMTLVEKGKYTIDINIKDFFDVAEADLENIGKLGIIVRAQYEGDNNKTNDLFLDVAVSAGGGEGGDTPEPPTPGTVYYMKNNWNEGEWAWKAMTQDGETYKLESVIFGGNGVNYNTAESDEGATWVPADQIQGDKIAANDTVTFVLDPVAKTVTATLVSAGGDTPEPPTPGTVYYMKNNWGAGADWTWKAMTQDGETYKLESVIFGGTGVNYNTAESDEGATWVPADQIQGDKIAAKDTVTFVLDPAAKTVTATLVGKYQEGGDPEPPTPGEHTYTVAGSSADAFGTAWAPANTDNDMSLVEGLYTWEKADLTLAAGTIEFKVCEDHAWTTAYPGENYKLNIPEAGIYTITITFNAGTKEVNAVATKTGSAVVVPSIAMHGNFTGSWVDTEKFTVAEGNATASLTLNLAAGNYEFGVRINGTWTSNGVAFARANASAVVVAGQGNLTLAADAAGEYTFTWTYETNTLAITFPEKSGTGIEETIAAGKAAKVLRNGQIFILKGDKIYNVMGATIK